MSDNVATLAGHGKIVCRKCHTVVAQCRCINHTEVNYVSSCMKCKDKQPTAVLAVGNMAEVEAVKEAIRKGVLPRSVPCSKCGAKPDERCNEAGAVILTYHAERVALAEKLPAIMFNSTLTPTDKAVIVYYAFVMMADSVASHSKEMFEGKEFTSQDIQRYFANEAVKECRKDGLLK